MCQICGHTENKMLTNAANRASQETFAPIRPIDNNNRPYKIPTITAIAPPFPWHVN